MGPRPVMVHWIHGDAYTILGMIWVQTYVYNTVYTWNTIQWI